MRVLDLFCGAGAAADGYLAAGFEVVGVDIAPQPRFPGPFLQMDALSLDLRFLAYFDAIHASPPCQGYTGMNAPGSRKAEHVRLIGPTIRLLEKAGLPWIVENVDSAAARAEMPGAVVLCGSMFGLAAHGFQLRRHRLFKTSFAIATPACRHTSPTIGIYGGHARNRSARAGGRGTRDAWPNGHAEAAHAAMGLSRRMTLDEVSEAIPPAYTRFIGGELMAHLVGERRAA